MRTLRIVPSWLKLQYPITTYARDAQAGYWWDITTSGLTTKERALAVSLRWRWLALMDQDESFAGLIPNAGIRNYTYAQIRSSKRNQSERS